jgi:putative membrane protein
LDAFLSDLYPWTKALHIISIIAWMAGLLYLPRLFVYHAEAAAGSDKAETFKIMERRLLRAIMNPAMVAAYLFGTMLLLTPGIADWSSGSLYTKLVFVGILTVLHHVFALWRKAFALDRNPRSVGLYRAMNEAPALLMIGIVIMVVVRPF